MLLKRLFRGSLEDQEPQCDPLPPNEPEGPADEHLGQFDVFHQALADHHAHVAVLPALLAEPLELRVVGRMGVEVAFRQVDAHAQAAHPDGHTEVAHDGSFAAASGARGASAAGEVRGGERLEALLNREMKKSSGRRDFKSISRHFERIRMHFER